MVDSSFPCFFPYHDVRSRICSRTQYVFHCSPSQAHDATVWLARHLPQNRDLFGTTGGNGTLNIYK